MSRKVMCHAEMQPYILQLARNIIWLSLDLCDLIERGRGVNGFRVTKATCLFK